MWKIDFIKKLFPWPVVSSLEAWLLRVLFAYALIHFLPPVMVQTTQPSPVGLAHWFDFTWMASPDSYATFKQLFMVFAFAYACGYCLPVTLPVLTVLHAMPYTLMNSQGHPHHGYQILTLSLLAMAIAAIATSTRRKPSAADALAIVGVFAAARMFTWWLQSSMMSSLAAWMAAHLDGTNAMRVMTLAGLVSFTLLAIMLKQFMSRGRSLIAEPDEKTNGWQLLAGQTAIAAAYLTSVVSKLWNSDGKWFANSHNVAIDFVKTTRQSYYSKLDPALQFDPPGVRMLLENEWLARAFFSSGVVLETVLLIAIGTRKLAFVFGVMLLAMHRTIMELMTLTFHTNESAVALFYINVPFLIVVAGQKLGLTTSNKLESHAANLNQA
ncbi:MAG: hypothetical protein JNJ83_20230 [Verrucomicrobiaceae bacterium]|nr:hypothetical protein [Verrucomicrobiaceae bacterium]